MKYGLIICVTILAILMLSIVYAECGLCKPPLQCVVECDIDGKCTENCVNIAEITAAKQLANLQAVDENTELIGEISVSTSGTIKNSNITIESVGAIVALESYKNRKEIKYAGLLNAIDTVKNVETKLHLEEVFSKISDKKQEQLDKIMNKSLSTDKNMTTLIGKKQSKLFGLFTVERTVKYEIDEDGEVKEKGIGRIFYKDIE
jgi:hypothetical protein